MNKDLQDEIKMLQREIVKSEDKILNFANEGDSEIAKKCLSTMQADLKYLSIIVNGAPIDPKQNLKIREFLRVHYENLWRIPIPA